MKTLRIVLSLIPVAGVLSGAFVANRIGPFVLGLPFLLFWVCAWALGGALLMGVVYLLDPANRRGSEE